MFQGVSEILHQFIGSLSHEVLYILRWFRISSRVVKFTLNIPQDTLSTASMFIF